MAEARAAEERRRRRAQLALAAAVVALATLTGGGLWWQERQATARFSRWSLPPAERGTMCSTSNGKLNASAGAWQYSQLLFARSKISP